MSSDTTGMDDAHMAHPRVLVISNNCFSSTGSNGRTLADLFYGWKTSELAQFFIAPEAPDSPVCAQYFRVTDREALRSLWNRAAHVGGPIGVNDGVPKDDSAVDNLRHVRKTPATSLLRHVVWSLGPWSRRGFMSWAEAFNPHLILLQAGDAPFLFALARRLALTRGIPLVILNTEDYYFKTHNYMPDSRPNILSSSAYRVFSRVLRRQVTRAYAVASVGVFNSDGLRLMHEEEFGVRAVTVMPLTTLRPRVGTSRNLRTTFSYLGNLGHGRHAALMEIGAALKRVEQDACLDVYGRVPNQEVLSDLQSAPGIRYMGVVPYDRVVSVMHSTDVLVHAESFLDHHRSQIKHAFSTKLADYMASGACVFVYAPPELWLTRYLQETRAAVLVTDPLDLEDTLRRIISSEEERSRYAEQAIVVSARSHSFEGNVDCFQAILRDVVKQ